MLFSEAIFVVENALQGTFTIATVRPSVSAKWGFNQHSCTPNTLDIAAPAPHFSISVNKPRDLRLFCQVLAVNSSLDLIVSAQNEPG